MSAEALADGTDEVLSAIRSALYESRRKKRASGKHDDFAE